MKSAALVALLLTTTPLAALDLGNGFSLSGAIEFEYADSGSIGSTVLHGDPTLSWRNPGSGALGFGADLTLEGLYIESQDDDALVIWGGAVLTTGFGEFTLGAARPVIDTVYAMPPFGTGLFQEFAGQGTISGSIFKQSATFVALFGTRSPTPAGLSFTGATGGLRYGVSLHQLDQDGFEGRSGQLALTYDLGDTTLTAAFESANFAGISGTGVQVGVLHDIGALTLGGSYGRNENETGSDIKSFRLLATYDITEAITLGADLAETSQGTATDSVWAITGEYRFGGGGFVEGSIGGDSGQTIWDIGLGYRF